MSKFVEDFSKLLSRHEANERKLDTALSFEAAGGEHRLAVVVDHTNPAIKNAMEEIIAELIPGKVILDAVLKRLEQTNRKSKDHFLRRAVDQFPQTESSNT